MLLKGFFFSNRKRLGQLFSARGTEKQNIAWGLKIPRLNLSGCSVGKIQRQREVIPQPWGRSQSEGAPRGAVLKPLGRETMPSVGVYQPFLALSRRL